VRGRGFNKIPSYSIIAKRSSLREIPFYIAKNQEGYKMRLRKWRTATSLVMAAALLAGCSSKPAPSVAETTEAPATEAESTVAETEETTEMENADPSNPLYFDVDGEYTTDTIVVGDEEVTFRSYKGLSYVENPVDAEAQVMNIYIPEAYFAGESIGGFTADSAPIFFPNSIGQYLPSSPAVPSMEGAVSAEAYRAGMTGGSAEGEGSPNAALYAQSMGYVVAAPGTRGRTSQAEDGTYTGKAPAGLVDLKAAVRYLHYNDSVMPGDAEKIISNGTSAGGAMSALVGATGDHADYEPYLEELGAADASDAVYAVSSYCPITNLENADMAYEWMYQGLNDYTQMIITKVDGEIHRERRSDTMTDE
jgi:hypothetical protein